MNVGGTARSVEIYAFAPGIDPASLDVQLEKGVLTIAGERKRAAAQGRPGHRAYRRTLRRAASAGW
jgi:HSP20 family molecular chaperone IbpA